MDEADGSVDVGRRSLIESDPSFMKRSIDHEEKRLFSAEVVLYIFGPSPPPPPDFPLLARLQ